MGRESQSIGPDDPKKIEERMLREDVENSRQEDNRIAEETGVAEVEQETLIQVKEEMQRNEKGKRITDQIIPINPSFLSYSSLG